MKDENANIVKITLLFSAIVVVIFSLHFNISKDQSKKMNERGPFGEASVLRFDINDSGDREIAERGVFKEATLGDTTITLEIVDTKADKARGLSGRSSIGLADGMLFVFSNEGTHGIWMKEMKFSLDIIWIDSLGKVVFIKEEISPDTFPEVFKPETPAKFVIEVAAGTVSREGWKVGSRLLFH